MKNLLLCSISSLMLLGSLSASALTIQSQCDTNAQLSITLQPDPIKGCFIDQWFTTVKPSGSWSTSKSGCQYLVAIVGGEVKKNVDNDTTLTLVNRGQICGFQ